MGAEHPVIFFSRCLNPRVPVELKPMAINLDHYTVCLTSSQRGLTNCDGGDTEIALQGDSYAVAL